MTKEELIKLSRENLRKSKQGSLCECYDEAFIKGYELSKKRIAELEYQLTHRNCVDCSNHSSNLRMRNLDLEKENVELKKENKVLAQNLEDTEILNKTYEKRFDDLEKENAELKDDNKVMADNYSKMEQKFYDNLTKAKELLERLLITSCNSDVLNLLPNCSEVLRVRVEAEQFLKDCEVEK